MSDVTSFKTERRTYGISVLLSFRKSTLTRKEVTLSIYQIFYRCSKYSSILNMRKIVLLSRLVLVLESIIFFRVGLPLRTILQIGYPGAYYWLLLFIDRLSNSFGLNIGPKIVTNGKHKRPKAMEISLMDKSVQRGTFLAICVGAEVFFSYFSDSDLNSSRLPRQTVRQTFLFECWDYYTLSLKYAWRHEPLLKPV